MDTLPTADDSFCTNLAVCYEVLLYLSSRMAKLKIGQVLEFVTSDPSAAEKVPTWCDLRQFVLVDSYQLADGRQRFLIQR